MRTARFATVASVLWVLCTWALCTTGCSHDWGELTSKDSGPDAPADASRDARGDAPCMPSTEICNDEDDDCDGAVDELDGGCGCTPGESRSCGLPGRCAGATQTCVEGRWGGCTIEPIDEICNDEDDDCDGSTDEGLPTTTYCRDADGDLHGDSGDTRTTCGEPPANYIEDCTDCLDSDSDVHPDQMGWFTSPHSGGSFDYDCDGEERVRLRTDASCETDGSGGCRVQSGWASGFTPGCGVSTDWVPFASREDACVRNSTTCEWDESFFTTMQQECR